MVVEGLTIRSSYGQRSRCCGWAGRGGGWVGGRLRKLEYVKAVSSSVKLSLST